MSMLNSQRPDPIVVRCDAVTKKFLEEISQWIQQRKIKVPKEYGVSEWRYYRGYPCWLVLKYVVEQQHTAMKNPAHKPADKPKDKVKKR